jgi:chromosome partitioning protein
MVFSMKQWMSVEEVAAAQQVSEETVRRWLRTGTLSGTRPSHGQWRIDVKHFEAFANVSTSSLASAPTGDEPYPIYSLVSLKGGVSKSTSAMFFAAVVHAQGTPCVLIDGDEEHSGTRWAHSAAVNGQPLPFEVIPAEDLKLATQAKALSRSSAVIIDTPPNQREIAMQAAGISDACIVPLAPTALDIDRLTSTLLLLRSVEAIKPDLNVQILVTRVNKREKLAREIFDVLQGFPVLQSYIRDLTRYKEAFGTTPEYLEEYQSVWKELHA